MWGTYEGQHLGKRVRVPMHAGSRIMPALDALHGKPPHNSAALNGHSAVKVQGNSPMHVCRGYMCCRNMPLKPCTSY
jgi:hypothetical protein